jgi:hypothetical protein
MGVSKPAAADASDTRAVRRSEDGPDTAAGGHAARGFPARMLIYLVERFSLLTVVPASLLQYLFIARQAGSRLDVQDWARWLVGFCTYLGVFLVLRFSDEVKDKAHDDMYYHARPVQRGLISLKELSASLWALVILLTLLNAFFSSAAGFALYLVTMAYLALMRFEFFVPHLLRPRLLLYLITHQLFVPLLAAYVIYHEGGRIGGLADVLVLVLVLLMIMAVEVARKIRPTYLDSTGRDTYSAYLGRPGAVCFLLGVLALAQVLFSVAAGVPPLVGLLLLVPGSACLYYVWKDSKRSAGAVLGATVLLLAVDMLVSL